MDGPWLTTTYMKLRVENFLFYHRTLLLVQLLKKKWGTLGGEFLKIIIKSLVLTGTIYHVE